MTEIDATRRRFAALGFIAAILIYEQAGTSHRSFEKTDFYAIVDRSAEHVGRWLYVQPAFTDTKGVKSVSVYGEVFGMWVGLRANVPVVNGYSGRLPPGDYPWGSGLPDEAIVHWLKGRFRGNLTILTPDDPSRTRVVVVE